MNAPLKKEQFCAAINTIKNYWDSIRTIENTIGVVFCEGILMDIMDGYVNTLCAIMKDEPAEGALLGDLPWIMYFCWDKDFGRGYHDGDVTVDGKEFPLTNPEELYNLLIKLYWTEEN